MTRSQPSTSFAQCDSTCCPSQRPLPATCLPRNTIRLSFPQRAASPWPMKPVPPAIMIFLSFLFRDLELLFCFASGIDREMYSAGLFMLQGFATQFEKYRHIEEVHNPQDKDNGSHFDAEY